MIQMSKINENLKIKFSKFNKKIEAIFEQIKNIQIQTNTLIKTRDALLPKLMSGEIRV